MRAREWLATVVVVGGIGATGFILPREVPQRQGMWSQVFPKPTPKPYVPPPPSGWREEARKQRRAVVVVDAPPVPVVVKPLPVPVAVGLPVPSKWRVGNGGVVEHLEASGWVKVAFEGTAVSVREVAGGQAELQAADGTRWISRENGAAWSRLPL